VCLGRSPLGQERSFKAQKRFALAQKRFAQAQERSRLTLLALVEGRLSSMLWSVRLRMAAPSLLGAALVTGCGASIRGMYESDVRFEHCMALDARPDVKPTVQRACWDEWISFYTFGQTRDRIEHARYRRKELGVASDFDEGDDPPRKVAGAAPDPTSAIAPPPSMMVSADAGAAEAGAPANDRAYLVATCITGCDRGLETCRDTCKRTPPCEQACAARHKRCSTRCETKLQGSR
jgi:hypothetical protein